jgi:hypothetical protein
VYNFLIELSSYQKNTVARVVGSLPKIILQLHFCCFDLQFSASVEMGLRAGELNINMQNELVRDVCTSLINYNPCPNKTERIHVAKKIIEKYPCMADAKILDSSTEWVCNCINMLEVRKSLHMISICAGLLGVNMVI